MKTLIVENHQPVPLRPVREVMSKPCEAMWVGPLVSYQTKKAEGDPVGWVRCGTNEEWLELEDNKWSSASYMFFLQSYDVDLDLTMARPLQPGERIVITIS